MLTLNRTNGGKDDCEQLDGWDLACGKGGKKTTTQSLLQGVGKERGGKKPMEASVPLRGAWEKKKKKVRTTKKR